MKTCSKCGMSKQSSGFRVFARSSDGLSAWCIQCHLDASRAHYQANKAARHASAKSWAMANPDKVREIRQAHNKKHSSKRKASSHEWALNNRDARRATSAKRKAAKLQATPSWADIPAIRGIYKEALRRQEETGIRMHVDHIVPLQSAFVCGLHCEANLQILPGAENESKKNYRWPDMPQAQGQLIPHEQPKQVQESLV